jgi:hypothetical protein
MDFRSSTNGRLVSRPRCQAWRQVPHGFRIGIDLELVQAQGLEMSVPGRLVGEALVGMPRQQGQGRGRHVQLLHVGQSLVIDEERLLAGLKQPTATAG